VIRITSLHGEPKDKEEFDRHYRFVHTPLVQRIPGVRNYQFGRVLDTVDGEPAPYYVVSDVYFDDRRALDNALDSPEMQAAIADVPNFATGGVTIMFCEYEDFPPTPTDAH
jgi:uncharacterized protein (TIGR02118 family)